MSELQEPQAWTEEERPGGEAEPLVKYASAVPSPRRALVACIAGSVLCTFGDHLHATQGVLGYPHVFAWSQAWWVPLLFFVSTLGVLTLTTVLRRALGGASVDPSWYGVAGDALAFITAYAFTAYAAVLPDVVLGVLTAWWIARMLSSRAASWVVALGAALAVLGPIVEHIVSSLGLFAYRYPDFWGVPRWLPALYLHIAPLAARLEARTRA